MSDESMNSSAPAPFTAGPQTVMPPAPKSRNTGTAIIIAAAGLVVLAAIAGIVAYVLLSAGSSGLVPAAGPVTPGVPGASGATSTPTGTVAPIPATDNTDVFTPRNPFAIIDPIQIASTNDDENNDNGSNEGTSTSTALTLKDITTANGEDVAVVKIGGTEYTVGEGDTVGTTQWQVVQINDEDVLFLYGDQRITIALGQGTTSK